MISSLWTGKLRHGAAQRLQGTAGRGAGMQTQAPGLGAALRLRWSGQSTLSSRVLVTATRGAVSQASPGADVRPGAPRLRGRRHPSRFVLTAHGPRSLRPRYAPCPFLVGPSQLPGGRG